VTDEAPQRWDTGRVEAFSDGVFAIAITLLVLDIHVDPEAYGDLRHALLHEWPAYLAYLTSFLTVGSLWIAHHGLFSRLRYVDPVLLRINLLLLLVAAFLPFPTGVLAEAFHASDAAERTAVAFYGLTALLIELLLRAGVRYAAGKPELHDPARGGITQPPRRQGTAWFGALLYGAAILVGLLTFPRLAAALYLFVAVRGVLVIGGEGRLGVRGLTRG
jgi:uncharacterized membrane protein